jgi:hypothetical protein
MASGSSSLTITSWDTLKFSWWENSQSIANNYTVVGWKMELVAGSSGRISSSVSKVWAVTVNGTKYEGSNTVGISNNSTKTLASGTTTIYHGSDGKKTFSYSFAQQFGITFSGTYIGTKSSSGSGTLTTIPREAKITAAPNFNDEENPTITYSNPAGSSVTSLQACISLDGSSADIAYRNISKTGTSYTFILDEAERNVLRNATTGSNSRTVRFYVQTVIGGNTYRNYLSKTFSIINGTPTLSPTVTDTGSVSTVLTGDPSGTVIRYFNSMSVSTGAVARKGATITKQSVTCGSKSISTASGKLQYVDSGTFVFSVTDNRGNTVTKTIGPPDITLIPYIKPTCDLKLTAPTPAGNMKFTISGKFFNGSLGAVQNEVSVKYRYKVSGGSYPDEWTLTTPTLGNNTYTSAVSLSGLDYEQTYIFQAMVEDTLTQEGEMYSVTTPERAVKTKPVFDWGQNDFRVNVDMNVYGQLGSTGINTGELDVTGGTLLEGDLLVEGSYVMTDLPAGTDFDDVFTINRYTLISVGSAGYLNCPLTSGTGILEVVSGGNNGQRHQIVTACSKPNPTRWERVYYQSSWSGWICTYWNGNKVLWGGDMTSGMYMTGTHTANLTEAISAQRNGIVLVFSYYNGASDTNWNWQCFFVPKYVVGVSTSGHTFPLMRSNFSVMGTKYLYIYDTYIKGHDDNDDTGTTNGVTYANNRFVLRYVLGV